MIWNGRRISTAAAACCLALLGLAPLSAASAQDSTPPQTQADSSAQISLSRSLVSFGTLEVDARAERTLTVTNRGDAALIVSKIEIDSDLIGARFAAPSLPDELKDMARELRGSLILAPGQSQDVSFHINAFKVEPASYSRQCVLHTNDPKYPEVRLPISVEVVPKQERPESSTRQGATPLVPPSPESLIGNPRPKIEADPVHFEFGEVFCGQTIDRTCTLSNTGIGVLEISQIRGSCDCTATELRVGDRVYSAESLAAGLSAPARLEPRQTATLNLRFHSGLEIGSPELELDKSIFIYTNDPLLNPMRLSLHAQLKNPIHCEDNTLRFGTIGRRDTPSMSTRFHAEGIGDHRVLSASCEIPELFDAEVHPAEPTAEGAPAYEVRVQVRPGARPAYYRTRVLVALDNDKIQTLAIPVDLQVQPDIVCKGSSEIATELFDFGSAERGGEATASIELHNLHPQVPYYPSGIELRAPKGVASLDHEIIELERGKHYRLDLHAKGIERAFQGQLIVLSTHAGTPRKTLRFMGRVAPIGQSETEDGTPNP